MHKIENLEKKDVFAEFVDSFAKEFKTKHGYKYLNVNKGQNKNLGIYALDYNLIGKDIYISRDNDGNKNKIQICTIEDSNYEIKIDGKIICTVINGETKFTKLISFLGNNGEALYKDKLIKTIFEIKKLLDDNIIAKTTKELAKIL